MASKHSHGTTSRAVTRTKAVWVELLPLPLREPTLLASSLTSAVGRVGMWRGGGRIGLSVAAPLVWRGRATRLPGSRERDNWSSGSEAAGSAFRSCPLGRRRDRRLHPCELFYGRLGAAVPRLTHRRHGTAIGARRRQRRSRPSAGGVRQLPDALEHGPPAGALPLALLHHGKSKICCTNVASTSATRRCGFGGLVAIADTVRT